MPRPIILNQSSFKSFQNCQRLYGWQRLQNLTPPGRRSALAIGTAIHAGLAALHAGSTLAESLVLTHEKLVEEAGPTSTFEDKDLAEAEGIIDNLLPAYVEHWKSVGELWTPLNQEIQFLVEVGEDTNVWLRGRADNLSTAKGGLYLVDYKTAGRMDPRDLLKYELDIQLSAYIYGLTKHLSAEAALRGEGPVFIRGAIIDVLVKTKIPQFARELYTRSVDELQEFVDEFVEIASRIRDQEDRVRAGEDWKTVFPKSTEHCFKYGTCPFRDVCVKDTPVRRALYNSRSRDYVDDATRDLELSQGVTPLTPLPGDLT